MNLPLKSEVRNSSYESLPIKEKRDEQGNTRRLKRDIQIDIDFIGDKFYLSIIVSNHANDLHDYLNTISGKKTMIEMPLTSTKLFEYVKSCLTVWQEMIDYQESIKAQDRTKKPSYPFKNNYNVNQEILQKFGQKLATAGARLFNGIFNPHKNQNILEISHYLQKSSSIRSLVIKIVSDKFFVPWGMLYTHPKIDEKFDTVKGSNFCWEGFWGLRHIIEHDLERVNLNNKLTLNTHKKIPTCINFDKNIDLTSGLSSTPVSDLKNFFKTLTVLDLTIKTTKLEFLKMLSSEEFSQKILYFFCHGREQKKRRDQTPEISTVTLTDGEAIKREDIEGVLGGRDLVSNPLVFISACQEGQMMTQFYETIGAEFLNRKSLALIGLQIDIPIVFAAEYSKRFFERFLDDSKKRIYIGDLMRSLSNEFLSKHNNPLGLTYSLYHGADCFVDHNSSSL